MLAVLYEMITLLLTNYCSPVQTCVLSLSQMYQVVCSFQTTVCFVSAQPQRRRKDAGKAEKCRRSPNSEILQWPPNTKPPIQAPALCHLSLACRPQQTSSQHGKFHDPRGGKWWRHDDWGRSRTGCSHHAWWFWPCQVSCIILSLESVDTYLAYMKVYTRIEKRE